MAAGLRVRSIMAGSHVTKCEAAGDIAFTVRKQQEMNPAAPLACSSFP